MSRKNPAKAIRLSPMVPSTDLVATKDFLVKALGFGIAMDSPDYVVLTKDGFDLHIFPAVNQAGEMSIYLEVDDLEESWNCLRTKLTKDIRVKKTVQKGLRNDGISRRYTASEYLVIRRTENVTNRGRSIKSG